MSTDSVKAQIRALPPDTLESRGVLTKAKTGYICPLCGNGDGKDGTGIDFHEKGGAYVGKCFKCGAGFDNFKLLGLHYRLDTANANDFVEICKRACEDFNIPADFTYMGEARAMADNLASKKKEIDPDELELVHTDIEAAQKNLVNIPDVAQRGLTIETLKHFGCGFIGNWTHPKSRLGDGYYDVPTPRLIIPTSNHYLARLTVPLENFPESQREKIKPKAHAGSKEPFDMDVLDSVSAESFIAVTEGEIDAMSIWQASGGTALVVATGGATSWKDFLASLKACGYGGDGKTIRLLILYDPDETGRKAAAEFRDAAIEAGIPATAHFLSPDVCKLDANDILIQQGADALADKLKEISAVAQEDFQQAAEKIATNQKLKARISEWIADNGAIDPAVMQRLKADAEYLTSLTTDKITAAVAAESKTLRAVANCRFYDFYRETAESFMARVDTVRAQAAAKIKKAPADATADDRELASIPARNQRDDSIAKLITQITKIHKAYQKALADKRAREEAAARRAALQKARTAQEERLAQLKELPASPDRDTEMVAIVADMLDWQKDSHGNRIAAKSTALNYKRIFENDPVADGLFGYDEFQQADVFLKPAPWKKKFVPCELWQDCDDSALRVYLRETYTELANEKLYADYLSVYSRKRSFHVVKDWLAQLPAWDGVERAATIFADYLQVEDSPYSRAVTLNWLTGSLARIFYPGCEYQTALVLNGSQGIGKSGILKLLGGKWYVALKDSVEDSHALDVIQTGWIVEIEEFWAGSKAEVSALKAFLSACADDRRAPFARRAGKFLRHCSFAITTNDEQFLKDVTGNRRFMILHSSADKLDNSAIKKLTPEIVNQIWAEALYRFRQMFPTDEDFDAGKLELPDEFRQQAEKIATGYMYDDGLAAEIEAFLDTKIPAPNIWDKLTKEQRRKFFVAGYVELDTIETEECLKDLISNAEEYDRLLATASPVTFPTGNGGHETKAYRFRGVRYRDETCAAEIFNECFGNDNRKKIRRINELLPTLTGWQLSTRPDGEQTRQRNFAEVYGDQKRIYTRLTEQAKADSTSTTDNGWLKDWPDPGLPF